MIIADTLNLEKMKRAIVLYFFAIVFSKTHGQDSILLNTKNIALFFAINNYENENLRDLTNPISDAKSIASELKRIYRFDIEVIENPTLDEIEDKIIEYKSFFDGPNSNSKTYTKGQLLIFFTGHGSIEDEIGYFLPRDANPGALFKSALPYSIWRSKIDAINCDHILVAIDACFSGAFDPFYGHRSNNFEWERIDELDEREKLILNHQKKISRFFFTSGSLEKTPDKSGFAKKFLEGLQSGGGKDGILTSTELYTFLEVASPKPIPGEFGRDMPGSSFLFISDSGLPYYNWSGIETSLIPITTSKFIYGIESSVLLIKSLRDGGTASNQGLKKEDVILKFIHPEINEQLDENSLRVWENTLNKGEVGVVKILRTGIQGSQILEIKIKRP